jgi:GAF domain-containing protein
MTSQLRGMITNLEQRVSDRTKELERRSQQIQTAADVGSAVASIRDLKLLLPQVTQLISERFNFYHVGIFLLDTNGEFAVLNAANSVGGRRMLARGHRLRVGEEGIVGFVTKNKVPRIALDVGEDAVHFLNPDLPDTRSEMALPLISGGRLLGAMDVQSVEPAAFQDEDIETLQVVADQVAVAIENANLFSETQEALETTQRLYTQQSQQAWQHLLSEQDIMGYLASASDQITPISTDWTDEMVKAAQNGEIVHDGDHTIAVPIILRDQVLGVVRLQKSDEAGEWTGNETELADILIDQIVLELESARLYDETQRLAARERLVTEITTKIRASNDPQFMLQTAVSELRQVLQAKRAQVRLQSKDGDK